ncbi:MAG: hypothetical protein JOZ24_01610 [Candidatus Eremiobacteraeota bacterium]|nr:hypothetical protein [Candidatus Eremiobacteraeota bacterium]
MRHPARPRSADVAVGYAADPRGRGIAFAAIATGRGRTVARVPFAFAPVPALDGREAGYGAAAAVAAQLRSNGFTRVRLRVGDAELVEELAGSRVVPPPLAMPYVKTRCLLHGFSAARVERAEPVEIRELEARARAEIGARTPAAA